MLPRNPYGRGWASDRGFYASFYAPWMNATMASTTTTMKVTMEGDEFIGDDNDDGDGDDEDDDDDVDNWQDWW